MLMILGPYPFLLQTLPYQSVRRAHEWRLPSQSRVGARPATQYVGPGDDTLDLSGVLMPAITGGQLSVDALAALANLGKSWPLIDGTGRILGLYAIEGLERDESYLFADGAAQRIGFHLHLRRTDSWSTGVSALLGAAGALLGAI